MVGRVTEHGSGLSYQGVWARSPASLFSKNEASFATGKIWRVAVRVRETLTKCFEHRLTTRRRHTRSTSASALLRPRRWLPPRPRGRPSPRRRRSVARSGCAVRRRATTPRSRRPISRGGCAWSRSSARTGPPGAPRPTTVSMCVSFSVTRSFPVRFGLWTVPTTRTVRGFPQHVRSSPPDTVSTTLKHERNCKSIQAASPARRAAPAQPASQPRYRFGILFESG